MEQPTIYIIPTFNTQAVTLITNTILTEVQMYNVALQNDEPVSVPSGRTRGQLLVAAQQSYIETWKWMDTPRLSQHLSKQDFEVLESVVNALEHLLLSGTVGLKPKEVL